MVLKGKKLDIQYPRDLIEQAKGLPSKQAVPCSVLVNKMEVGGVLITCSTDDLNCFNISPVKSSEPPLKYRMLNYEQSIFVVEIWLQFMRSPQRYFKVHLNPYDAAVHKFLDLGDKTQLQAFHFYNSETHQLATSIAHLDGDKASWFERNSPLAKRISPDPLGFLDLSKLLGLEMSSRDRFFEYYSESSLDFFVKEGGDLVSFYQMSELN